MNTQLDPIQSGKAGEVGSLVADLKTKLSRALTHLKAHTEAVERDLEQEKENLQLVSKQSEAVQKQLGFLSESLRDLHQSLSGVKSDVTSSLDSVSKLEEIFPNKEAHESVNGNDDGYSVEMSAKEASARRHDEPITVGSVIRSLLMADEPGQRERRDSESL